MAKLERLTNKIFGAGASTTGENPEIGKFGSAKDGSYIGTGDVAEIQSSEAWSKGWINAVTPDEQFPTLPEMTGVHKVLSYQTGYLLQEGIAEYDANTTYYKGSLVKSYETELKLYVSIVDNNQGNNLTDNTKWNEVPLTGVYHPPLLSFQWSDHLLDDMQWLRADTFSWQSGNVYVRAYNELVSQYNNEESTQEQYGEIIFKRTPKGYKIVTSEYENAVNELYSTTGVSWFYIIDTNNTRFKLPRTKYGFKGLRNSVGDYVTQQVVLPNITGTIQCPDDAYLTTDGAFYIAGQSGSEAGGTGSQYIVKFDASRSSSVYSGDGNNTVIRERGSEMYLYFYVGEYAQSAIEQTAGLNAELFNGKADLSSPQMQAPYLKTTYKNGTSGYNIWSNGYCEQWGIKLSISPNTVQTIDLIKTYEDTNFLITLTTYWDNALGYADKFASVYEPPTASSFKFHTRYFSDGNNVGLCWKTSGYLAEGEY